MSIDHRSVAPSPLDGLKPPTFLSVRPGMTVVVQNAIPVAHNDQPSWWMGQVIWCEGGARDPKVNTMFQIADVDDGTIRWVNADQVTHIL